MSVDPRLEGKPATNDGSLPIMHYDYRELPRISEGIWHAQMAGWPRILTYDYVSDAQRRRRLVGGKRYENIRKSGVVYSRDSSADEYPFASTVENAGSTFISNVPGHEQHRQGGLISAFYQRHHDLIRSGKPFWFEVKVIHGPFG
jgi:hypothetical protein